ncbi:NUDIX domain-containing protein [Streptomyces sp. NPDC001553]|uniref:NUDIX domain-containing protein n=1 Tax=Streptomyces sp. NPDC001553 TaxID=3154385 RepID=UPI0033213601
MIPDLVSDLRKAVGPDCLLWLPGVVGVVLDEHGRVLLQRRSAAGLWTPLSGILEPGEAPAAGVVREVAEETGVRVRPDHSRPPHSPTRTVEKSPAARGLRRGSGGQCGWVGGTGTPPGRLTLRPQWPEQHPSRVAGFRCRSRVGVHVGVRFG